LDTNHNPHAIDIKNDIAECVIVPLILLLQGRGVGFAMPAVRVECVEHARCRVEGGGRDVW
jgi:hypothetical protein